MRIHCFILVFILTAFNSSAQYFRVSGKIVNNKLEPLALVSVKVKGTVSGTISNENGFYEVKLEAGKYDLMYTMVGFKPQVITLVVNKDYVQNIILEEEQKSLDEAIVRTKFRDRSVEIIKNVIRHKEELLNAAGAYSATVYIKATQEDSSRRRNKKLKPIPDSVLKKFSGFDKMSMAEVITLYDHENSKNVKEERIAVSKRGNAESLFFLSLTEGDFNLYNNLLYSRTLAQVPFISPVSYSGLAAYRYKVLSTTHSGNHKVYTISVKPRDLSNVTVEGEITILDSAWVLLHANFRLPSYHLPEYDFFEVDQQYDLVQGKAWMISRQQFTYYSKHGKGKLNGSTVVQYSGFEFNKKFPAKYFGTELSVTGQQAYERDSLFWQQTRTEPLTPKEIHFINFKDSIYRVTHTKSFLDSIDSENNKVTWKKLAFWGQSFYNREKKRTWYMPSLSSIYQPFQFGGTRIKISSYYSKSYPSKKSISLWGEASYGIRNNDINGNIRFIKMYNPFNRAFYRIEAGRDFQYIFLGDAWINMLKRSNLYLNNSIGLGHGQEILNGLFLNLNVDMASRRSLADYKTNPNVDSSLGGSAWFDNNRAVAFPSYNAFYGKVRLSYTPAQRYIREPAEKIIVGSKWPTIYTEWRKGIPVVFNSKVDFDYLEFGLEQELKLGVTGVSRYSLRSGSFINKKDLRLVDYKFQRRGDPILFMYPEESFQSLDSTFAVFKRFYLAHYIHEFNGAIINKIPFLKKIQLREVAGGGFLLAPERNLRYAEFFVGLERAFKWPFDKLQKFKLGVYMVGSVANKLNDPVQFKIGITSWDRTRDKWY